MTNPSAKPFDPSDMERATIDRIRRKSVVTGTLRLPAVPEMAEQYAAMCTKVFSRVGSVFNDEQVVHLTQVLTHQASQAYAQSAQADIVLTFTKPFGLVLNYEVVVELPATAEAGHSARELLHREPDARVWLLAAAAPDPALYRVLDIGAGTGRNALALARRGHPVDAVEQNQRLATGLCEAVEAESLGLRVFPDDMFAAHIELRHDYQLVVLSEVTSEFTSTEQLRAVFALAADRLAPDGQLVCNAFVNSATQEIDDVTRQVSAHMNSTVFSWAEIEAAAAGAGLELVADDAVYEFEQANLPEGAWPPADGYAAWVAGQDVYALPREKCPSEMRWLVYQKASAAPVADPAVVAAPAEISPAEELAAVEVAETPDDAAQPPAGQPTRGLVQKARQSVLRRFRK